MEVVIKVDEANERTGGRNSLRKRMTKLDRTMKPGHEASLAL